MFWTKVVLLVHLFVVIVGAQDTKNFRLQIGLVRFLNTASLDLSDFCCNFGCTDCFSSITFCLRDITILTDFCPLRVQFNINDDDINFETEDTIIDTSSGSTISNPFSLMVSPGTYQLAIEIRNTADNIGIAGDFISNIDVQAAGAEMEQTHSVRDRWRRISLEYTYQVLCTPNFYGPACSTFCAPTDDSTGHFRCGDSGEVICLPGYVNQSSGGGGRCTVCDSMSRVCEDKPNEEITSEAPDGNDTRNDLEASRENLSGGAVTGVVLSILIVIAIAVVGSVVGALLWKYQPWESNTLIKARDALNNPIYELDNVGSAPYALMRGKQQQVTGKQITVSMESSPLYSSQSADDNATPRSQYMENDSLLSILHIPKSKSQEPIGPSARGGEERSFGGKSSSRSAMDLTASGNATVAVKIDPYGSYVEDVSFPTAAADEPDYELVGSPTFDDPQL